MEPKCNFCDKLREWADGKLEIKVTDDLCRNCIEKILITQLIALSANFKALLNFQKSISEKNTPLIHKMLKLSEWFKKDLDKGDEWKKEE